MVTRGRKYISAMVGPLGISCCSGGCLAQVFLPEFVTNNNDFDVGGIFLLLVPDFTHVVVSFRYGILCFCKTLSVYRGVLSRRDV